MAGMVLDLLQQVRSKDGVRGTRWRTGARPKISPLSLDEKRELALKANVPPPGSGLPGAWDDGLDADRVILVPFTDESVDSYETILANDGWDFGRYSSNPVLQAQHVANTGWDSTEGALRAALPIGRSLLIEDGELEGEDGVRRPGRIMHALVSRSDLSEIADLYYRNWMAGTLRGSSVGFRATAGHWAKGEDVKKFKIPEDKELGRIFIFDEQQLFENSLVTLPANASTTRSAAVAEISRMARRGVVTFDDARALWGVELTQNLDRDLFPDVPIEQDGLVELAGAGCGRGANPVQNDLTAAQARIEELETEIQKLRGEAGRRSLRAKVEEGRRLIQDLDSAAAKLGELLA